MTRYVFCEGAAVNEYFPLSSVVAAITLPDGLINTTVTFASGTWFASRMRPVILIFVRNREAAARIDSSDNACGWDVSFGDSDTGGTAGSVFGVSVDAADSVFGVSVGAADSVFGASVGAAGSIVGTSAVT